MKRTPLTRLRLRTVDRVTDPSPDIIAHWDALYEDLRARGYDVADAARLSAMALNPALLVAFAGTGTRRSDLPGYRPPDRETR